jgi:hypothetical protein
VYGRQSALHPVIVPTDNLAWYDLQFRRFIPADRSERDRHFPCFGFAAMAKNPIGCADFRWWAQAELWAKSAAWTVGRSLPVYPDNRTSSVSAATSQECHQRTCRRASAGCSISSFQEGLVVNSALIADIAQRGQHVRFVPILLQKSAYRRRGTLMPFFAAVAFHPRDCAGDLRSTLLTPATLTQRIKGRLVVAGRSTWQACGGSAQSLPT